MAITLGDPWQKTQPSAIDAAAAAQKHIYGNPTRIFIPFLSVFSVYILFRQRFLGYNKGCRFTSNQSGVFSKTACKNRPTASPARSRRTAHTFRKSQCQPPRHFPRRLPPGPGGSPGPRPIALRENKQKGR